MKTMVVKRNFIPKSWISILLHSVSHCERPCVAQFFQFWNAEYISWDEMLLSLSGILHYYAMLLSLLEYMTLLQLVFIFPFFFYGYIFIPSWISVYLSIYIYICIIKLCKIQVFCNVYNVQNSLESTILCKGASITICSHSFLLRL